MCSVQELIQNSKDFLRIPKVESKQIIGLLRNYYVLFMIHRNS